MLEHIKIRSLDDYFVKLSSRPSKGVFFYRISGYSDEIGNFIRNYYKQAAKRGVVIEGRIPNPDENNLSYYEEIMGLDFRMDPGFITRSLKKWMPRMSESQRSDVAASMYRSLDRMFRSGMTEKSISSRKSGFNI